MRTFRRVVAAVVTVALLGVCALGCNTVKGVGKDIEKGGKSIQKAADKAQKK